MKTTQLYRKHKWGKQCNVI